MEKLDFTTLLAIIGSVVGVFTVLARVIENLVVHVLDSRKNPPKSVKVVSTKYTTDLAVQRRAIDEVQEDVEKIENMIRAVETTTSKDLPYQIEQIGTRLTHIHEELHKLQAVFEQVRPAMEGNTQATDRLYDLLAKVLRVDG